MAQPEIAVVVPTRDRPLALGRCLAALAAQEGCGPLEVAVADDGSREPDRVAAAVSALPSARVVRLEGRGPAAARNAGVAATTAPVVCFTDDDCEPAPGWAAALASAVRGTAAAAGPTLTGRPGSAYADATQLIVDYLGERSRTPERMRAFAPGSNLACRRSVLEETPFDERFHGFGEDRDWCLRLLARGHALAWVPEAVVHHWPELTLRSYLVKHVRYGRGARALRRLARSGGLEPPEFYARLVWAGVRRDPATGALVLLAQVATAAGYAAEAVGELLARRPGG